METYSFNPISTSLDPRDLDWIDSQLDRIPGIQVRGSEKPKHPWSRNWLGIETLSSTDIDNTDSEPVTWVREISLNEKLGGEYFFLLTWPPSRMPDIWVRAYFDPQCKWVEKLWLFWRSLNFVSIDETYMLHISVTERTYTAKAKHRSLVPDLPSYFDIQSHTLTQLRRLRGKYDLAGYLNGDAALVDTQGTRVLRVFPGYSKYVNCVGVTDDLVVSNPEADILELWNTSTGEIVRQFQKYEELVTKNFLTFTLFSPQHILTAFADADGTIGLHNFTTGMIAAVFKAENYLLGVIQFDSDRFVSFSRSGKLTLWDINSKAPQHIFQVHDAPITSVITFDDIVVSCSLDKRICVLNVASGESTYPIQTNFPIHRLTKVGNYLLTVSGVHSKHPQKYYLEMFDFQTGANLDQIEINAPSLWPRYMEMLNGDTIAVDFAGDQLLLVRIVEDEKGQPHLARLRDVHLSKD
jgi:WD40 repeat protein